VIDRLGDHLVVNRDCVEAMGDLPDCSVDAIVTDPPYGLGFMGKKWDDLPPGDDFAREALRVCKPGAYIVAFGGTRTVHRLTVALEDAGFEIRDTLHWCYWSGFPKSLDVSKAMDKRGGSFVPFVAFRDALRDAMKARNLSRREAKAALGNDMLGHYLTNGTQPAVPNWRDYQILRDLVGLDPSWDEHFKPSAEREVVGRRTTGIGTGRGSVAIMRDGDRNITQPATESARQWQGWGTALKPAIEPAVMARKPLTGTVADNVLEWGTGALNIDASRIAYGDPAWPGGDDLARTIAKNPGRSDSVTSAVYGGVARQQVINVSGRFPANLYYCPKASTAEREAGCSDLRQQAAGELTGGREEGSAGLDSPRAGAGRTSEGRGNSHPTVKPIRLMRWIVRLVTPPNGVVLEPFAGSGTTLLATELADIGARCIAIEREAQYIDIIRARFGAREVLRRMLSRPVSEDESESIMRQCSLFEGGP
jgi:hypothetical protein